eukprot:jgi/Tetstr1/422620/TSEL_013426.t1
MAAPDRIPRAWALVHTKKGLCALNTCLLFGADAIERDVAEDSPTDYPSRDNEHAGVVVAPRWAVEHARGVFLANAPAVTSTADGGDEMSPDICRPPRPPFDELELVAASVAHAKAAKDKAAAKKRHDIEDDEDNDDQDSDEDLGLASLPAASEFCRKCGKSTTVDGLPVVGEEALVSAVTEAMCDRMNGHGHHMELPTGFSLDPSDPKAWPFLTAFDDPKVYAMRELHALCEAHFMHPMDDSDALRDVMA